MSTGLFSYVTPLGSTPAKADERSPSPSKGMSKSTRRKILASIAEAIHSHRTLFGRTINNAKRAFEVFDRNSSGKISLTEFAEGLRRLDVILTPEQTRELLGAIDSNGDGLFLYRVPPISPAPS